MSVEHGFDRLGEWIIGAGLALIAWVMKTFTTQHLESMDKLTDKVDGMGRDISEMKGDIKSLTTRVERAEEWQDRHAP